MFGFKRQRLIAQLIEQVDSCFGPVQDEIGNVPVAIQQDVEMLATLYAIIYSQLAASRMDTEKDRHIVTDKVFEAVFRRDAVAILNRCDQMFGDKNSEFCKVFDRVYCAEGANRTMFDKLAAYIDENYEKQEYRD